MSSLSSRAARAIPVLLFVALLAYPAAAHAQFYGAAYLGGNHTRTTDVHVDQPAAGTAILFHDVTFAAKPLASPQYYGVRLGRLFGHARRYGLEIEFIHLKVISNTGETVHVTGVLAGEPVDERMPMDAIAQRYAMTHGLNFLLVNGVLRHPLGQRLALVSRLGVGPTYPHAESRIYDIPREQYEYAGIGGHVATGLDVRLGHRLSAVIEYKFTAARPRISVDEGRGRMRALTHQVGVGLAFGLWR